MLTSRNHQDKTQKCEKSDFKKDTSAAWELKQEGVAVLPLSWEHVGQEAQILLCSDPVHDDHKLVANTDLGVTNAFWCVGKFEDVESAKDEK